MLSGADALLAQVEAECARQERVEKLGIVSGTKLMQTAFPPPRFLWGDVLPDSGLTVLGAKKGLGKTLLLLQLAGAISRGRSFMGLDTTLTKCLFCELEMSPRIMQSRLRKMGEVPNDNFDFLYVCGQGTEGLQAILEAVALNLYGLVIIDVVQRLWPPECDPNDYQATYGFLGPLRAKAHEMGVQIILVSHVKKGEVVDFVDGIIGSTAIVGNCDVVMSLTRTRGEDEATLNITGNDIEGKKLALRFQSDPLGFVLSDASPDEIALTPERREVLGAIRALGGTARPGQVATELGKDRSNVGHLMQAMESIGVLKVVGTGIYSLKNTIPTIPTAPTSRENNADLERGGNDGSSGKGTFRPSIPAYRQSDFPAVVPQKPEPEDELTDDELLDIF